MRSYPIEKYRFQFFDITNEDNSSSKVTVAVSRYHGKNVRGVARCMDGDSYSPEIGKKLAAARCDLKVCTKRKNRAHKKHKEALENLNKAMAYYTKMCRYYDDATYDFKQSAKRLVELEDSLI